jgi:hypothetical protein
MTAIAITDELGREVAAVASAQGQTPEEFVSEVLSQAVRAARLARTTRNGLPVMLTGQGTPPIDPAMVREAIEEQGF